MKQKTRQTILLVLMVFVFLLVLKRYLPMIEIPTEGLVEERLRKLKSLQGDLLVARKGYQNRVADMRSIQDLTAPFWVPSSPGAKVDQEIASEFNRITRLSQLASATGSQKVDVSKEKNGSCLQEVILSVDFKNVSMRDLSRFFTQLRNSPKGRKFRWEYCKIQPDNAKNPTSVNMSARFKIQVLNSDTLTFLGFAGPSATPATTDTKPRGRN